jgi:hypothetical protein
MNRRGVLGLNGVFLPSKSTILISFLGVAFSSFMRVVFEQSLLQFSLKYI